MQLFSCEICEIFKSTLLKNICEQHLLIILEFITDMGSIILIGHVGLWCRFCRLLSQIQRHFIFSVSALYLRKNNIGPQLIFFCQEDFCLTWFIPLSKFPFYYGVYACHFAVFIRHISHSISVWFLQWFISEKLMLTFHPFHKIFFICDISYICRNVFFMFQLAFYLAKSTINTP